MNAIPKIPPEQQLTIEEFLAFTASRPTGERWELIEGAAVMNPSPVGTHQLITMNIGTFLMNHKRASSAAWIPLLGVGTKVPSAPRSLPQPDIYVQEGTVRDSPITDDALVIFEVLSRSNSKADQAWRRKVYASVANCQHYVTVSMKIAEVTVYDRASQWKARTIEGLEAIAALPAIGVELPLADGYRYTPIGQG